MYQLISELLDKGVPKSNNLYFNLDDDRLQALHPQESIFACTKAPLSPPIFLIGKKQEAGPYIFSLSGTGCFNLIIRQKIINKTRLIFENAPGR